MLERIPTPSPPSTPVETESVRNGIMPNGSHPASAGSSGPGTPTRDEIPAHEVQAAIVAAAAAMLQNSSVLEASETRTDDSHPCPLESEGSPKDGPMQHHPLSVLVCNRSSSSTNDGDVGGGYPRSHTMDERFQYVPRFRPTSTRTYTRARNRSPHQESTSPTHDEISDEPADKRQRDSPTSRGFETTSELSLELSLLI